MIARGRSFLALTIRSRISSPQCGSVLLELLWAVPAFAAGLGLIIAVGVYLNARSALQDAVSNGLSLAASRAETPTPLLNVLSPTFPDAALARLLVSREFDDGDIKQILQDGYAATSYTITSVDKAVGEIKVRTKPLLRGARATEVLAMAYIAQALEIHTLGDVRFPCALNDASPGCLSCRFIPGSGAGSVQNSFAYMSAETTFPEPIVALLVAPSGTSGYEGDVLSRRLSVLCRYYPRHPLVDLLSGLARGIGFNSFSFGAITASAAVDYR